MLEAILILLAVLAAAVIVYAFLVRGKKGHPGLAAFAGWSYAHRGLHDAEKPENSMAAFRAALENGYGIELDVHLLKDGTLAVIHDSSLKRTTGQEGDVEDLTAAELSQYHLEGTDETIPTFRQVLELYNGKAPLIVELKSHKNNCAALTEAVCRLLDDYRGAYCLESFDPRCIRWLYKNRPELIRGQLTENFFKSKTSPLPWYLKLALSKQLMNFLILPHFVSYKFADRKTFGNFLVRRLWGVPCVTWTLVTPQEHETALKEGWIPIFENYKP